MVWFWDAASRRRKSSSSRVMRASLRISSRSRAATEPWSGGIWLVCVPEEVLLSTPGNTFERNDEKVGAFPLSLLPRVVDDLLGVDTSNAAFVVSPFVLPPLCKSPPPVVVKGTASNGLSSVCWLDILNERGTWSTLNASDTFPGACVLWVGPHRGGSGRHTPFGSSEACLENENKRRSIVNIINFYLFFYLSTRSAPARSRWPADTPPPWLPRTSSP